MRFLSCEPLLGPLDGIDLTGIGWVIAGGESGPRLPADGAVLGTRDPRRLPRRRCAVLLQAVGWPYPEGIRPRTRRTALGRDARRSNRLGVIDILRVPHRFDGRCQRSADGCLGCQLDQLLCPEQALVSILRDSSFDFPGGAHLLKRYTVLGEHYSMILLPVAFADAKITV